METFAPMLRSSLAAIAALCLAAPATASRCLDPDTLEAVRVRDMQTMLMVGALRCRTTDPTIASAYNRFILRARDRLVRGEERLLRHYSDHGGREVYDRFTAQLANRHSQEMEKPGMCLVVARVLAADESSNGGIVEAVAALPMAPLGAGEPCEAQKRSTIAANSPFEPIPE
jgi:hypothetical protein